MDDSDDSEIDACKRLLEWALAEMQRAVRARPELADEVRKFLRDATEQHLPAVRASLAEILANSTDPGATAKAAELLAKLNSSHGEGTEA